MTKKDVVIFGVGTSGLRTKELLKRTTLNLLNFCDNDPASWGTEIEGVKVISPKELLNLAGHAQIVISSQWSQEINKQLMELGIMDSVIVNKHDTTILDNLDKLFEVYKLLKDDDSKATFNSIILFRFMGDPSYLHVARYPQYFHPEVFPAENDTIIDGGAFIGDTVKKFTSELENKCKIYSFEPCQETYEKLVNYITEAGLNEVVVPTRKGLSNNQILTYLNKRNPVNPAGYRIVENESMFTEEIETISLDDFLSGENIQKVDFIKLDIEGSELAALNGAVKTIKRNKPRLQISLYHKPADLFEIPLFLQETFKDHQYSYYIGHHHRGPWETVLYALPN